MAVSLSVMVLLSLWVTSSLGARVIANFRLKPVEEFPRSHLPMYTYHACAAACMSAKSCTSFTIGFSTEVCVLGVAVGDLTEQQQSNSLQYSTENFQPKQSSVEEIFDPLPVSVLVDYPIIRSLGKLQSYLEAEGNCGHCGKQLCSLDDLKAAHDVGYRDDQWGFTSELGQKAKVTSCDGLIGEDECYSLDDGVIPFTPNSTFNGSAYCCLKENMGHKYPFFITSESIYRNDNSSAAEDRCAGCGMQLCSLGQLLVAHAAGYRRPDWWGVAAGGGLARVSSCSAYYINNGNECHFVVPGNYTASLIPNRYGVTATNLPAYCCHKCHVEEKYPIFRTAESYSVADLSDAQSRCDLCGMQLCTTAQLRAAYNAGYRDNTWGLIDIKGRHAKVSSCDELSNSPDECHFIVEGRSSESLIPHTITTANSEPAYCCKATCHTLNNYPFFYTSSFYGNDDMSAAEDRCAECGMQLCTLDQLRAAHVAGHRHSDWGMYAARGWLARVSSCGDYYYRTNQCHFVVVGDDIKSLIGNLYRIRTNVHAYCCHKCYVEEEYPIFRTVESYSVADLSDAQSRCDLCGMQLCTTAQLRAAYNAGYRDNTWGLIDIKGRHAKVSSCDELSNSPDECHFIVEGRSSESLIPHTITTATSEPTYCCQATCHTYSNYPIFRTVGQYWTNDLSQAINRCAECGMQLCTLDQLKAAYDAGFRDPDWGLYDVPGRIATVDECGEYHYVRGYCHFVVPGNYTTSLIPNFGRPDRNVRAFCCHTCDVEEKYPIFKTSQIYPSADVTQARGSCSLCGMELCSLAQLKEAYDAGYRSGDWGLYDVQGRHAQVTSCGIFLEDPNECYFVVAENATASLIPNTPVSIEREAAYCCKPLL